MGASSELTLPVASLVVSPAEEKRIINRVYLHTLSWLFFVSIFTYLDRANLAFAAPSFKKDLHLDNTQYGLGSGLLFLGYGVGMLPSNLALERFGAPFWLAFLVIGWGISSGMMAAVRGVHAFYIIRVLIGLFEAGTFPGAWYYMATFFNHHELNYGIGVMMSASIFSQVIGAPLAAGFLYMDGFLHVAGWQWVFIIEAVMTVTFGIALWFGLPRSPRTSRFLTPQERDWLQDRNDRNTARAKSKDDKAGSLWAPLLNWRMYHICTAWWLMQCVQFSVLYFTPLIVDAMLTHNFTGKPVASKLEGKAQAAYTAKIALVSALLFIPGASSMWIIGWSSGKFKERNLHGAIPLFMSGIAFMCVPTAVAKAGPIPGFVVMIIAAIGSWAAYGPVVSWPATFLHGRALVSGYPMFNTFAALGGFCGPYLVGALSDKGGYGTAMLVLGGFDLVAGLLILVFRAPDLYEANGQDADAFEGKPVVAPTQESSGTREVSPLAASASGADGAGRRSSSESRRSSISKPSPSKLEPGMVFTVSGLARSSKTPNSKADDV
eukprot:jgi/Botrbrau1/3051/Bobra.0070s0046.1